MYIVQSYIIILWVIFYDCKIILGPRGPEVFEHKTHTWHKSDMMDFLINIYNYI